MKDFTDVFNHFRISARGIWNTAFWPDLDCRNWDARDQFDEISRILFDQLVLVKADHEWPMHDIFRAPMPFFQIEPGSPTTRILIRNPRPGHGDGYWDHPINGVSQGQAVLQFIECFDWNRMDYADFQYYMVRISKFEGQPDVVGRDALIEASHTRVFLVEE